MQLETVKYEVNQDIARLTLNRPKAKNAINLQMAKDLLTVAQKCKADTTIRTVIISSVGDAFCVGGDVREFGANQDRLSHHLSEITFYLHEAVSVFFNMEVPIITAVNGAAAGAGIGLACLGDKVLAAESARFMMAYSGVGLSPDAGATFFLPRLVGIRNALDFILSNKQLSALEAREIGLVNEVIADGELARRAEVIASDFASRATKALASSKHLLYHGWNQSLSAQLNNEREMISTLGNTYDAVEGVKAFNEKRQPKFQGN